MTKIAGSRILMTGAASGFGRLMSLMMAAKGGRMVLWDIDQSGLDGIVAEIEAAGGEAHGMVCDLRDRLAIERLADEVLESGPVDVLVNNAGIVSGRSLLELEPEQIEATFDVNALALFWTTRCFLPAMLKQDSGHVVTIASAAGLNGTAQLVDYSASKFAAVGFDESLRAELRQMKSRVRTTVVCPFVADTGMFEGVRRHFFLLPVLKQNKVAAKTVRAIERNRRRLLMPRFVYASYPCRMLPVGLNDWIGDVLGVNRTMQGFIGRRED